MRNILYLQISLRYSLNHTVIYNGIHTVIYTGIHTVIYTGIHTVIHTGIYAVIHTVIHTGIYAVIHMTTCHSSRTVSDVLHAGSDAFHVLQPHTGLVSKTVNPLL